MNNDYSARKQELRMKILLLVERLDELEIEGVEEVDEKTHQEISTLYDEIRYFLLYDETISLLRKGE